MSKAFKALHIDKNGIITLNELDYAQGKLAELTQFSIRGSLEEVFKAADLDGDGKIDFHEFFAAAIDHKKILTEANVESLFKTFDTNEDGKLDVNEFRTALPTNYRGTKVAIEYHGM